MVALYLLLALSIMVKNANTHSKTDTNSDSAVQININIADTTTGMQSPTRRSNAQYHVHPETRALLPAAAILGVPSSSISANQHHWQSRLTQNLAAEPNIDSQMHMHPVPVSFQMRHKLPSFQTVRTPSSELRILVF